MFVRASLYRVEQKKRMFFKCLVLDKVGVGDVRRESADSSDNAVSVVMTYWNVEHRVFAAEQFYRNCDSVVTVRRLFSFESSMLKVEMQFQIETLYCDWLKHLELKDLSIRQEISAVQQKML